MRLRYNYRVYPDADQRSALAQAFGCARVVWNDCLRARKDAHAAGMPYVSSSELSKAFITRAKRTEERRWLGDVSAVVLQQSLRDLDTAFRNFFASLKDGRKGRRHGPPRFKPKKDPRQGIRLNTNAFVLRDDGRLYVAKVGDLKVRWSRPLPAAPTSLTVIKDAAGRYFASFVVAVRPDGLAEVGAEVGIDLGLTTFAVLSDGSKISSPRFLRRAEKKLKRLQRELSRKADGSSNRAKARTKLARQHAKVADRRRDWHHKTSTRIVRDNQAVYVEDLAVHALGRTGLAKSVHDAGWGPSCACWSTRRPSTAATSGGSAASCRPPRRVPRAGTATGPSRCTSAHGPVRPVARSTTVTRTQRSTPWPPDGRTGQTPRGARVGPGRELRRRAVKQEAARSAGRHVNGFNTGPARL